jgi:hypothetical protein
MNPGNEPPEIPSFKPPTGQPDEKKGGGMVPSSAKPTPSSGFKFPGFGGGSTGASKAFSAPNLKVRGLGGGGATVMDRLKNLRKKDLIFIGAGLCTLGMAPLAEHLLMSPEEQSAKLQEGFNSQQGPLFQDGSSVYEPGNGVGSPGGLVGQGQDVITPLNVRDPSNLIMSPGAQKKADAVASATAPPPPSAPAKESDWKDVLRDSAKSGAGKAVSQAAKLPKPNVKMAGAIRGLSALGGGGGGTGAALKLDPLSARGVPNTAAGSNALTRSQATPGFRGATSRSGASSGAGEDLRAAGARQSDIFNKGGGASAALDAASREAIPTGGASSGGGGRPGEGGESKNPGGNSHKDNKSLGESLAFLRQKMEMEKSLDLKWERKKWNEFGRQKMLEESAIKLGFDMFGKIAEKTVVAGIGDWFDQMRQGGPDPTYECKGDRIPGGVVRGTKGSLARQGFILKPGGWVVFGDKADPIGKCVTVGDPAGPGTGDQYERPPGSIAGPPASEHTARVTGGLAASYAKVCTSGAPGYLGTDLCSQLSDMQGYVQVHMGKAEDKKNEAQRTIGAAYKLMENQLAGLKLGQGGTAATVGVPTQQGGAVPADAPLPKYLAVANPAVDSLKTPPADEPTAVKTNLAAKTSLTSAKTDAYEKAVGAAQGGGCGQGAGGTLAVACKAKTDATSQAADVAQNLTAATAQLGEATQSIADGRKAVGDMTPKAGLAGGHVTTFQSFQRDAMAAFQGIEGEVATAKRHWENANKVNDTRVVTAKTAFEGGLTATEGLFAPDAAGGVVAHLDKWVEATPAVPPPAGKTAVMAVAENYAAIQAQHAAVVKGDASARQAVQAAEQPLTTAEAKVKECLPTFECTP